MFIKLSSDPDRSQGWEGWLAPAVSPKRPGKYLKQTAKKGDHHKHIKGTKIPKGLVCLVFRTNSSCVSDFVVAVSFSAACQVTIAGKPLSDLLGETAGASHPSQP